MHTQYTPVYVPHQHSASTAPTPKPSDSTSTLTVPIPTSTAEPTSSTLTTKTLAGVFGALVTCGLVAVIVIATAGLARKKKEGKTKDVRVLQEPPPLSPREGTSSPR